jgi:putative membrane protein insertion efficiency factor
MSIIIKLLKLAFIVPIKLYQIFISPLFPNKCIFNPTCSQYAILAIKKYGIIYGLYLVIKRIMRCHPYSVGGDDKLP